MSNFMAALLAASALATPLYGSGRRYSKWKDKGQQDLKRKERQRVKKARRQNRKKR